MSCCSVKLDPFVSEARGHARAPRDALMWGRDMQRTQVVTLSDSDQRLVEEAFSAAGSWSVTASD